MDRIVYSKMHSYFSQASDWEAKFYQIQSKYLLLLNELHNPQVNNRAFYVDCYISLC